MHTARERQTPPDSAEYHAWLAQQQRDHDAQERAAAWWAFQAEQGAQWTAHMLRTGCQLQGGAPHAL